MTNIVYRIQTYANMKHDKKNNHKTDGMPYTKSKLKPKKKKKKKKIGEQTKWNFI